MKKIMYFVVLLVSILTVQLVSAQTATIDGSSCPSAPACPKYVCESSTLNLLAGITSGSIDSLKWRERISLDGGTTYGSWTTVGTVLTQTVPVGETSTTGHAYQYWLIVYQGGIAHSAYAVTYVNANPNANLIANDTSVCAGTPVNFSASAGGTNYNFKVNNISVQSGASSSYASSTLINGDNITVVVTNGSGCTKTSSTITMIIYAVPTATITAGGPTTFCQGDNVVLTSSVAGSYQWYLNGSIIPLATSQNYTASVAGSYTVNITTGFCSATSITTVVTVKPLPIVTVTPLANDTISICNGSSTTLSTVFDGSYSYQWQSSLTKNPGTWTNVPSGGTSNSYVATIQRWYRVRVTLNGCTVDSNW